MTEELPIGRRVAYWRQRRTMSQQVFADRIGKSKSWVDKIERGVRRLDKFSVLHDIADVLQVDVQLLLGRDPERSSEAFNCVDQVEVEDIRQALERYERLGTLFEAAPIQPMPLDDFAKSVSHAWMTFEAANYAALARSLITLLKTGPAVEEEAADPQKTRAANLLSQVYQIASSVLRKLGEPQLAWLAADRAISAAQRGDDPLLIGTATTRVANALRSLGRSSAALDLNIQVAQKVLAQGGADPGAAALSVHGQLLLQGAMAAAQCGDLPTARELLRSADGIADLVGDGHNHYWTSFGPTNVALHRAAAAVELGEGRMAVNTHVRIDPEAFARLVPERRAHHYVDVARGYNQIGDHHEAGRLLVEAGRVAPLEIRCRPLAHQVISDVLRRSRGAAPAPLIAMAEELRLAA
ncbi:helix-turn-helix domain-containing protein [Actinorhabdospora filicis]|uniref:helix-turn-helix domain-containing protein n=1 Tax=Actinorhabdospora filicis TaxID=1785913 RepID=UPI002557BD6A|nr:helix-turn-helix domain-containing protein [Actinorhabdospora filicis]